MYFHAGLRHAPLLRCQWKKFAPDLEWVGIRGLQDVPDTCILASPILSVLMVSEDDYYFDLGFTILHHIYSTFHQVQLEGAVIGHTCSEPCFGLCVNPKHLRAMTKSEAVEARIAERRKLQLQGWDYPSLSPPQEDQGQSEIGAFSNKSSGFSKQQITIDQKVYLQRCFSHPTCNHVAPEVEELLRQSKSLILTQEWGVAQELAITIGEQMQSTLIFGLECTDCVCKQQHDVVKWRYYYGTNHRPSFSQMETFYRNMIHSEPELRSRLYEWFLVMGFDRRLIDQSFGVITEPS